MKSIAKSFAIELGTSLLKQNLNLGLLSKLY